ncbi:MAG TPA: hypothetical protein VFB79_15195 [Candidatus Angelobacter sp.]|nr:hypothetical protein [Candidatus Angelobacter sp.]
MGWIQEHLLQTSQKTDSNQAASEDRFTAAARERWLKLGEELRADVAEFNAHGSNADYAASGDNQYRVSNPASGLELVLTADFENHTVRYDYSAINQQTAGVPEGGMLSMRQSRMGRVEFYSADERLTSEETRQVLLEPMLFPRQSESAA